MKKYINKRMKEHYLDVLKQQNEYESWIKRLEQQEQKYEKLEYQPKISILVPVYNVLDKHLVPCIESVIGQSYPNWELCLADDCSTWSNVRKTLKKYEKNKKIKVVYRSENGHISRCTNSALEVATGEFIAFLDCDDVLAPNALYEVVKVLNENKQLDFIYSDEDKINDNGEQRHMPHFKPDWSPDTLLAHMYTCHFGVYRRSIAQDIGGIRAGFEGAQDYDFTLRFTEKTDKIAHISKILYHWREREESTAGTPEAKPYILEAAKKSKEEALKRRGLKGEVELIKEIYQYRINYLCDIWPKVSVIIPSKDNYDILKQCLESFHQITDYPDYEIILVDNGSNIETKEKYEDLTEKYRLHYMYHEEKFNFSHMCNMGAEVATGEYLLFLNDDIEIIDSKWLKRMVGQAAIDHIGAVGAKLLYPDRKTIQHVGVINIENGPVHALVGYSDEPVYYFGRNRMDYNQIAVTAACLLVNKEKFDEVSGFNEELAVAYNDIEFCFKLLEKGYYNIIRNDAVLVHHESVSRGNDLEDKKKYERLMAEQEKLYNLHPQYRGSDPFYNKNLAQNKCDFSYDEHIGIFAVNQKLGRYKISPKKERRIKVIVDYVACEDALVIKGWFFWKNSFWSNICNVKLLLRDRQNHIISFSVTRKIRKDVAETLGNVAYNIGFECRLPYESMRFNEEEYQIGIAVEVPRMSIRRITWTPRKTMIVPQELYMEVIKKEVELPEKKLFNNYEYKIEGIDKKLGKIYGWAVNPDSINNDYEDYRLVYQRDGKTYSRAVVRRKRLDVAGDYRNLPNALWSGFECIMPVEQMKDLTVDNIWIMNADRA